MVPRAKALLDGGGKLERWKLEDGPRLATVDG